MTSLKFLMKLRLNINFISFFLSYQIKNDYLENVLFQLFKYPIQPFLAGVNPCAADFLYHANVLE